jgi:hypothetical protein
MNKEYRFQDQNWMIKLWRYRHYLNIPYSTVKYRYFSRMADGNWRYAYDIAVGNAQFKMKWWYTLAETNKFLNEKNK